MNFNFLANIDIEITNPLVARTETPAQLYPFFRKPQTQNDIVRTVAINDYRILFTEEKVKDHLPKEVEDKTPDALSWESFPNVRFRLCREEWTVKSAKLSRTMKRIDKFVNFLSCYPTDVESIGYSLIDAGGTTVYQTQHVVADIHDAYQYLIERFRVYSYLVVSGVEPLYTGVRFAKSDDPYNVYWINPQGDAVEVKAQCSWTKHCLAQKAWLLMEEMKKMSESPFIQSQSSALRRPPRSALRKEREDQLDCKDLPRNQNENAPVKAFNDKYETVVPGGPGFLREYQCTAKQLLRADRKSVV